MKLKFVHNAKNPEAPSKIYILTRDDFDDDFVREVIRKAGFPKDTKFTYSRTCGCDCGCSPGFRTDYCVGLEVLVTD